MNELDQNYWNQRYEACTTGWDLGQPSPPIQAYFDQVPHKEKSILIPGAGNGHDVIELYRKGFESVYLLDFAPTPVEHFKKNFPEFPEHQLLIEDFFSHDGAYDLIAEQTLFCAIDPALRLNYVKKVHALLKPNGKLIGVLFNRDFEGGPPFGGNIQEYRSYFEPLFTSVEISDCYNSINPRRGAEVFIKITK